LIGYAEHVVELASLYLDREGHVDVDLRTTVILLLIAFGRHSFTRQTTTGPRWRRGAVVSVVRAGVTTSYRTSLYYNDSVQRRGVHVTVSPPDGTYLLGDLSPDTVYHIRLSAKSLRGEGVPTATIQVRTLEYGIVLTTHYLVGGVA